MRNVRTEGSEAETGRLLYSQRSGVCTCEDACTECSGISSSHSSSMNRLHAEEKERRLCTR